MTIKIYGCLHFFSNTERFYHSNALKTHFIYQLQAIESSFFFRKMHTYLTYQFYMLTSTCAFLIIILLYYKTEKKILINCQDYLGTKLLLA